MHLILRCSQTWMCIQEDPVKCSGQGYSNAFENLIPDAKLCRSIWLLIKIWHNFLALVQNTYGPEATEYGFPKCQACKSKACQHFMQEDSSRPYAHCGWSSNDHGALSIETRPQCDDHCEAAMAASLPSGYIAVSLCFLLYCCLRISDVSKDFSVTEEAPQPESVCIFG